MSQQLISRSPDLKRLRDEGFGVFIKSHKYLLVHPVPYVTSRREVTQGTLVCELTYAGNDVTKPADHVAYFIGEHPCDTNGRPISQISNASQRKELAKDVVVDHTFSAKPRGAGFHNFHEKVTAYVSIISGHAEVIDTRATARTFPVVEATEEESVFRYVDTASSRAGIDAITARLERGKIGIIGLGGTGSYILDFVSKTPVGEIHLFDGDRLSQHNAFRCPGAVSLEELAQHKKKVAYWQQKYDKLHRRIVDHDCFIDGSTTDLLVGLDFVFVCLDGGPAKKSVIDSLVKNATPFIDVGMGVVLNSDTLTGIVRTTTVTKDKNNHIAARVPLGGDGSQNEYAHNIQVAELNALSAALAVVKWKKLSGYYADTEKESHSLYVIGGNTIINEDLMYDQA